MNIVLMAGGGGSRLWPVSRRDHPKQFIDLGSGRTLLEETYNRAKKIVDSKNIFLATTQPFRDKVVDLLPDVPKQNIFLEPEKKDTTAAFVNVAVRLQHLGLGQEPTTFMWADHVFTREDEFISDLSKIPNIIRANPEYIVIVGHNPVTPEVTLGYMEVGDKVEGQKDVFYLKAFKEKPDLATAKKFLKAGNYYWNLGCFSMKPDYLIHELVSQSPDLKKIVEEFTAAVKTSQESAMAAVFKKFPKISIEYTLIEKTKRIIAVTGDYGWTDIGYWSKVQEIFGASGDHVPHGHHLHIDAEGSYIYNTTNKNVTLIGLKNVIAVVTDDAILITSKDDCYRVKEVVAKLEELNKTELL